MKNLRLTIFTVTLTFYLLGISAVYGSEVIDHEIDSKQIAGNKVGFSSVRKFQVYLPDEYRNNESERYPVIYWIPGFADSTTYQYQRSLDDAIRSRKIPATIAVFIDAREGILFLNSSVFGYGEDFLVKELIPFIDSTYRTIADKYSRCIAGHSAGGFTAV
jgi:enterochelin esterase-like enzyme